jgi:hypothetical protein
VDTLADRQQKLHQFAAAFLNVPAASDRRAAGQRG